MTPAERSAPSPLPDGTLEALRASVQHGLPRAIAELSELVRIPSVSWDGFDPAHVQASAERTAELLRELGVFDEVLVDRAPGPDGALGQPAVLARRAPEAGRPTVLLYAHHDVQPPGAESDWSSPPFEPTLRGDRLYGRGVADDKAGVMAHVAAIRALVETAGEPGLGIVVFIEGEEEFGSRSFGALLERHRDLLAADVIVVADSDNWSIDTPSLTVGLRGNATFSLTVSTLEHASHSGMLGGAVPDAMLATIALLATLHDADGAVAVDGLRSHEQPVPSIPEQRLRDEAGLLDGVTTIGRGELLHRLWAQPAITATGIDAPSVQNASNTLAPSVTVKISARIAPGQSPDEAFAAIERHLRAHAPFGAHLAFASVDLGAPFLVDTSGWAVDEALAAMAEAWGAEPQQVGVGGSIPFIAQLAETFPAAQVLVTGVEDPHTRAHSPDESLHLGVFQRAILTEAVLLTRIQAHGRIQADDVH
ncbi:dipeptidase [Microcella humidisoli]|uniref:Dipeptidase n=1 Tax=Microcella humidisoli TaxID=2963406 RepID=A0ABY5FV88_9MICO|nr:dipeptidase [Microcella humidisoli]UTT62221.1 dipeptidase [Microcella humidisoli]